MNVLLTGATGFTGSHVAKRLVEAGLPVTCLVRPTSDRSALRDLPVRFAEGTLEDVPSLTQALCGADTLVNVASLGFGHAPGILEACRRAGIGRAVFFSTTSIYTGLEPDSKSVRLDAERRIRESGIPWTILRPTMIYGSARDRNMCRLIRLLNRAPVMPVFGPGTHLQQPVYVEDLAAAVLSVLRTPATACRDYNVAGAEPLTFNQVIETVAALLGKRVRTVHLPLRAAVSAVAAYGRIAKRPRLTVEQVLRLNEDKAFPIDRAREDFQYAPLDFPTGIRREIEDLRARNAL